VRNLGRAAALLAVFLAVYLLQSRIDRSFGEYRATEEILYVEDGDLLRKLTMGFENLAADLYWLRTVQYFGGKRLQVTNKNYDVLEPLLWITVKLDPKFKIAYSYGSIFLSEPFPMGAGVPLKGVTLIDEGIRNHPGYWRFYLDKGFIYFWYLQDYKKAAEIFLEGSKFEGAPYWMVAIAGRTLTRGGDRETARGLWQILLRSAETDQQRENAITHLRQLDALDQIDLLERVIQAYRDRTGAHPASWAELVEAGLLPSPPLDPAGSPYRLEADGKVALSPGSSLGVLPLR
jgi:hypothetical protein